MLESSDAATTIVVWDVKGTPSFEGTSSDGEERAIATLAALKAFDAQLVKKPLAVAAPSRAALLSVPTTSTPPWALAMWEEMIHAEQSLFEPRSRKRAATANITLLDQAKRLESVQDSTRLPLSDVVENVANPSKRAKSLDPNSLLDAERALEMMTMNEVSTCTALVPWKPLPQKCHTKRTARRVRRKRHSDLSMAQLERMFASVEAVERQTDVDGNLDECSPIACL